MVTGVPGNQICIILVAQEVEYGKRQMAGIRGKYSQ